MDEWDDDALTTALRRRADAMDVGDVATVANTCDSAPGAGGGPLCRRRGGRRGAHRRGPRRRRRARDGDSSWRRRRPSRPRHRAVDDRRHQHDRAPADDTIHRGTVAARHHGGPADRTGLGRPDRRAARLRSSRTRSAGGSIEVEVSPSGLRLVGQPEPAAGYTVEVEDDRPDRVRVRFESGDRRSRITVELVDGQPAPRDRGELTQPSGLLQRVNRMRPPTDWIRRHALPLAVLVGVAAFAGAGLTMAGSRRRRAAANARPAADGRGEPELDQRGGHLDRPHDHDHDRDHDRPGDGGNGHRPVRPSTRRFDAGHRG